MARTVSFSVKPDVSSTAQKIIDHRDAYQGRSSSNPGSGGRPRDTNRYQHRLAVPKAVLAGNGHLNVPLYATTVVTAQPLPD